MSDEEKARQVGEAVAVFQAAKVELAHIETKLERTARAYSAAAQALAWSSGPHSLQLLDGTLRLGLGASAPPAAELLGAAELAELVRNRDSARQAEETARERLSSLGVSFLR